MSVEEKIPDDHPLMIAWKAYQETDDFKNSAYWARQVEQKHLMGSMWAIFMAGFHAGQKAYTEEMVKG